MVAFRQDGQEHLLVANSAPGLVKISCRDIDAQAPLTEPREPAGVPRVRRVFDRDLDRPDEDPRDPGSVTVSFRTC
jgi:hypothetical protein